jgi:hypothetical protein
LFLQFFYIRFVCFFSLPTVFRIHNYSVPVCVKIRRWIFPFLSFESDSDLVKNQI